MCNLDLQKERFSYEFSLVLQKSLVSVSRARPLFQAAKPKTRACPEVKTGTFCSV